MIIDWNIDLIIAEIDKICFAEADMRATGYETWRAKQDLYKLLWLLEDRLEQSSMYGSIEEDLILARQEKKIIKKLSGAHNEDQ